jgi:CRISPR/Cas system-associated exonuclease Cas4 (RecB family)
LIIDYVKHNQPLFNSQTKTELRFELLVSDTILNGSIDLASSINKKSMILELKTDENPNPDKYEMQLKIYAIAYEKLTRIKLDTGGIYDLRNNQLFEIDITPKSLEDVKKVVELITREINIYRNFPAKKSSHCSDCDMQLLCSKKK